MGGASQPLQATWRDFYQSHCYILVHDDSRGYHVFICVLSSFYPCTNRICLSVSYFCLLLSNNQYKCWQLMMCVCAIQITTNVWAIIIVPITQCASTRQVLILARVMTASKCRQTASILPVKVCHTHTMTLPVKVCHTHSYNDITCEGVSHSHNDITCDGVSHSYNDITCEGVSHSHSDITCVIIIIIIIMIFFHQILEWSGWLQWGFILLTGVDEQYSEPLALPDFVIFFFFLLLSLYFINKKKWKMMKWWRWRLRP